ncbi:MAG: acyl-CoA/acyl-ACP dehydrogenase [Deltaproteobacteria bacterium]|nr:MAG: acyl-CoA/acyl-ACP dehydrogenase [Deltaproteobacteria bacterium]
MDFGFSEEQTALRTLARGILEAEVTPERRKQAETGPDGFDRELWSTLAEANLLGLAVPESFGGMGFGLLELLVLLEEVGRSVAPLPALAALVLGGLPIARFGSAEQRKRWLPPLAAGQTVLSAGLVDADADDVTKPATRARRMDGAWVLDGRKRFVPFAACAERVLVPARVPDGVGLFLVDSGATGLERTRAETSTGEPSFDLTLAGVRVGADARLGGDAADGAAMARWLYEHALVATCALQVGVCERALEITAGYVREREQFGAPIGSFQAVSQRCADAFIDLEAIRWSTWRAAWRLAEGLPAAREAAVAKVWAAEAGVRIADTAQHLHGGIGVDVDYPIHRHFLWSRSLALGLGSAAPQLAWLGRDMARTGPQEGV